MALMPLIIQEAVRKDFNPNRTNSLLYETMVLVHDIVEISKGNSLISAAMSLGIVVGPRIGGFLADFGLKTQFLISSGK
jgi:hypothetical protein